MMALKSAASSLPQSRAVVPSEAVDRLIILVPSSSETQAYFVSSQICSDHHNHCRDSMAASPMHADRHLTYLTCCNAEILHEEDPASPPRRKGKGGRQRAPAPDATVDPKRAKRIMANRASAAKSKEKQKQKVMVRHHLWYTELLATCFAWGILRSLSRDDMACWTGCIGSSGLCLL